MINTIRLVNTAIASYLFWIVIFVRTFKIHSLSDFQGYRVVLAVVTMLWVTSPELTHLITKLLPFVHCLLISANLQPPFCSLLLWLRLLGSTCESMQYLSLSDLISLSRLPSSSTHVLMNDRVSLFPCLNISLCVCLCVCAVFSLATHPPTGT